MTPDRIATVLTSPTRVKEHTRRKPMTARERTTRALIREVLGKEALENMTKEFAAEFPAQTIAELREPEPPRSLLRRAWEWLTQFEVV